MLTAMLYIHVRWKWCCIQLKENYYYQVHKIKRTFNGVDGGVGRHDVFILLSFLRRLAVSHLEPLGGATIKPRRPLYRNTVVCGVDQAHVVRRVRNACETRWQSHRIAFVEILRFNESQGFVKKINVTIIRSLKCINMCVERNEAMLNTNMPRHI